MKVNLYFMRHAMTALNFYKINSGHLDIPILPSQNLNLKIDYDLILCSSMIRCKQTADLLANKNIPTIYDNGLIEAGYGDLTGKVKDHTKFKRNLYNFPPKSKYFVSESICSSGIRAKLCLESYSSLIKKNNYKNILIISHKNTIKGLLLNLNYNNLNIHLPELDNCDPWYFSYDIG